MGLVFSYGALCVAQALLVAVPVRVRRPSMHASLGLLLPAAALGLGVGLLRGLSDGSSALAVLATVAAPVLAAACPILLGWRRPGLWTLAVAALYLAAWQLPSIAGDAAGVALIGLACLALAGLLASVAPRWSIGVGLVLLAVLDVILVWGTPQVGPASTSLAHATLPTASLPGLSAHHLPELQQATFGDAQMGWLDLAAPALLAFAMPREQRLQAVILTGLAAGAWGLLLIVTSPIPATVPVAAVFLVLSWSALRHASRQWRPVSNTS